VTLRILECPLPWVALHVNHYLDDVKHDFSVSYTDLEIHVIWVARATHMSLGQAPIQVPEDDELSSRRAERRALPADVASSSPSPTSGNEQTAPAATQRPGPTAVLEDGPTDRSAICRDPGSHRFRPRREVERR
jgi:hypothetical protein